MSFNSLISDIHQCCCIPATSDEIMDTINQVEEALVPDIPEPPDEPEPTGDPEIIFTSIPFEDNAYKTTIGGTNDHTYNFPYEIKNPRSDGSLHVCTVVRLHYSNEKWFYDDNVLPGGGYNTENSDVYYCDFLTAPVEITNDNIILHVSKRYKPNFTGPRSLYFEYRYNNDTESVKVELLMNWDYNRNLFDLAPVIVVDQPTYDIQVPREGSVYEFTYSVQNPNNYELGNITVQNMNKCEVVLDSAENKITVTIAQNDTGEIKRPDFAIHLTWYFIVETNNYKEKTFDMKTVYFIQEG